MLVLVAVLWQAAASAQTNRDLEIRLMTIQENQAKIQENQRDEKRERDQAVRTVTGHMDDMQIRIESILVPELRRLAAAVEDANRKAIATREDTELEYLSTVAEIAGNAALFVAFFLLAIIRGVRATKGAFKSAGPIFRLEE